MPAPQPLVHSGYVCLNPKPFTTNMHYHILGISWRTNARHTSRVHSFVPSLSHRDDLTRESGASLRHPSAALQGKVLLLITNSDYVYTDTMMTYAYDPYLPEGRTWRDLFDMVIVQVRAMGCLFRV